MWSSWALWDLNKLVSYNISMESYYILQPESLTTSCVASLARPQASNRYGDTFTLTWCLQGKVGIGTQEKFSDQFKRVLNV